MADNTSSSCYNNFTTTDRAVIGLAGAAAATLSLLACLFVIGITVTYKKYVLTYQTLVLYLTICVLGDNVAHVVQGASYKAATLHHKYCQALGFFNEYLPLTIVMALACLVLELYLYVSKRDTTRLKWIYAAVIFLLPASMSWIPLAFGKYGLTGTVCFITYYDDDCEQDYTGLAFLVILWWLPYATTILVTGPLYFILLYRILHQQKRCPAKEPKKPLICPKAAEQLSYLKWLPLFVLGVSLLPIATAAIGYITQDSSVLISTISAIFLGLKGGFLAVPVALDPDTSKELNWNSFKAAWQENMEEVMSKSMPLEEEDQ